MKTNFKIGDKVKITNDVSIYTSYEEMAEKMNLTKWKRNPNFNCKSCNDNTGVIVSIQTCTYNNSILAGVDLGEKEIIIDLTGLELLNDIPEKWCIEMTKDNKDILYPWWNENAIHWNGCRILEGYTLLSTHPCDSSMYYCSNVNDFLESYPEYESITLEQFKTLLKTPIMDIKKSIKISRDILNEYYDSATLFQREFINEHFKLNGTTTVESIIGLHDLACDTWKNIIKENHPNCFPTAKTAIELAVEKAGKPDYDVCFVKIEGDLILVDLPNADADWSFAAFEWVLKFCKENQGHCCPVHYSVRDNSNYLYIQWND